MTKELLQKYKKEIKNMQKENKDNLLLVVDCGIENMIFSDESIDDSLLIMEDSYLIKKEQAKLLKFLRQNLKKIDSNELDKVLTTLKTVSQKTVDDQCYRLLSDNEQVKKIDGLQTVTDTDQFRKEVYGLTLKMNDIVKYLNYPSSFWAYILPRIIRTDEEKVHGIYVKCDEEEIVKDIKLYIPHIINLNTAKINIHEFRCAYDIYQMLNGVYVDGDYENSDEIIEEGFENNYLKQKVKKQFG